jgi:hypothetical protein
MVSSSQRERLLEKHRYINVELNYWWDCVYEHFKEDMEAVGITVWRMLFSGFASQGDGACFEGSLDDTLKYLDHHHKDQYPMIRKLLEHGGGLYVQCKHRGRYNHENCTDFWVSSDTLTGMVDQPTEFHEQIVENWQRQLEREMEDFEDDVIEQWRSYMQDLYSKLKAEYDHLTSDEAVWETIEANEWDQDEEDCDEAA